MQIPTNPAGPPGLGIGGAPLSLNPVVGTPNPRHPQYPHPIFSLADYNLPETMTKLYDLCAYFFMTSSLVHPVIHKMAEYPVTKFHFNSPSDDDQAVARVKRLVEKQWKGRQHLIEVGIHYLTFGNCIALVPYNCQRFLKCPRCQAYYQLARLPYRWVDFVPHALCPSPTCRYHGPFNTFRVYPRNEHFIRPVLLDPRCVDVKYNPITGTKKYLYRIPPALQRCIRSGDPYILESIQPIFIEAVKRAKKVELDEQCLFHFMRPGLSSLHGGLGMPSVAPVMKDLYYLNTLRRAQEAISLQHIVPLLVLFPQSGAHGGDMLSVANMGNVVQRIEQQFAKWRKDPNHVPIMPYPLGVEHIGGNARALMITPEMESVNHTIINGMLAPRELVEGGLSWSGSSISLRILENHFTNYRNDIEMYLDFALERVQDYLDWPSVQATLEPFRMADDVQKLHLKYQALASGHLSRTDFLGDLGVDPKSDHRQRMEDLVTERHYRQAEALMQSNAEGAAGVVQARYQARQTQALTHEQKKMMEGAMVEESGLALDSPEVLIDLIANMMLQSNEQAQAYAISMLTQMPTLAQAVQQRIGVLIGNPEAIAAEQAQQAGLPMDDGSGEGQPQQPPGPPGPQPTGPPQPTGGPQPGQPPAQPPAQPPGPGPLPGQNPPRRQVGGI